MSIDSKTLPLDAPSWARVMYDELMNIHNALTGCDKEPGVFERVRGLERSVKLLYTFCYVIGGAILSIVIALLVEYVKR